MEKKVDVFKELVAKNKEIYLNKLNIDLDNNHDNLLITIENVINLFAKEVTEKVLEIESNTLLYSFASKEILAFHKLIHQEIIELMNKRLLVLREKIKEMDNNDYKECLSNETDNIITKVQKKYLDNIEKLIKKLTKNSNTFTVSRIEDYLKVLNYNRFFSKLKEVFANMDIILYNNYVESKNKYQELNKKVII